MLYRVGISTDEQEMLLTCVSVSSTELVRRSCRSFRNGETMDVAAIADALLCCSFPVSKSSRRRDLNVYQSFLESMISRRRVNQCIETNCALGSSSNVSIMGLII